MKRSICDTAIYSTRPVIYALSPATSKEGTYALVYIYGINFLPSGTTLVDFGTYKNIEVGFYSSNNISFVVPANAPHGIYRVVVKNNNNLNYFSTFIYSNSFEYLIYV